MRISSPGVPGGVGVAVVNDILILPADCWTCWSVKNQMECRATLPACWAELQQTTFLGISN